MKNRNKEKNNIPELDIIVSHRKISEEDILKSKILIIKEEEGNLLGGKEIKINAGGMEEGRGKKDGVSIFSILNNNNNNHFKPDFYLNCEEKFSYPYIFVIYYENNNYYIRGYSREKSDNRLLYIKLNEYYSLPLKEKEIICVGNILFQINLLENNKIEITNLSDPNENKKIFESDIKEVTIGRNKNCNFSFPEDKSFSRKHTTFYFDDKKKEWIIFDGNKDKSSTNGTWVFGTHSFLIKNNMTAEILSSKFNFIIQDNI